MKKLLLLLLLPILVQAQTNVTVKRNASTGVVSTFLNPNNLDTLARGRLTGINSGDVWVWNTPLKMFTPYTLPAIDTNQYININGTQPLPAVGAVTVADGGAGTLTAGTYKIGVTAVSANGGEGAFDADGYYQTQTITIGASKKIDVSFNSVPDAVAYRIYVGDASQSYFIRYFQTTDTTYTINTQPAGLIIAPAMTVSQTGGNLIAGNYYSAVSAVFSDGETVGQVSWDQSEVVTVTSNVGSVGLTWSAVTGATGYKVWFWTETEGSWRFGTKYFNNATTSVTVTGNETYYRGLEALPKGNIELETSAPVIGSSFVQTGNNKNFFSADIAIIGNKGSMAELILQRYDSTLSPFGYGAFAGIGIRTGTGVNYQLGVGEVGNNNFNLYNYGANALSWNINYTTNKMKIYGDLQNVNTPIGTGGTDSVFVKKSDGAFGRIAPDYYASTASLGNYLPLAGGTLTGSLAGTAANFSEAVKVRGLGTLTGAGSEIVYSGGIGFFQTYDRTGAVYLPTVLAGSTLDLRIGGTSAIAVDASRNVGIGGAGTNPLTVINAGSSTFGAASQAKINSGTSGNRAEIHLTDGVTSDAFISFQPSATAGTRNVEISSNGAGGGIKAYGNGNLEVSGNISAANLTSGTYTPTLTNVTNTTSLSNGMDSQYMRVGNTVFVYGYATFTQTSTGNTEFEISLPIASNFGTNTQAVGTGTIAINGSAQNISIISDSTSDRAEVKLEALTSATSNALIYSFSYQIL